MTKKNTADGAIKAAFGAVNRNRLIDDYFRGANDGGAVAADVWRHVYRLLLWTDPTTGLAHCYESDKSQPGKHWYGRSLAFHDWVSTALGSSPAKLADDIDWLFRRATADLAAEVLHRAQRLARAATAQRDPYEGRKFPKPGEDPELISIVKDVLGPHLESAPSDETWQFLVQRVRQHITGENKRKNLVGEGFEDLLTHIIRRTSSGSNIEVGARRLLHDIPGFNRARRGDKPNKVDVAVIRPGMRTLVTAKWSVRADREKQFAADFSDYVLSESDRSPFEYVFVTNEFDPARLVRACEQLASNAPMFARVVHISPDAVRATYGSAAAGSMQRVLKHIQSGRLISLGKWLSHLAG